MNEPHYDWLLPIKRMTKMNEWICCLDQVLAWHERVLLTGYSMKRRNDDWLLILRAKKAGQPVVAFVRGEDYYGCWRALAFVISHSTLDWKPDKFA